MAFKTYNYVETRKILWHKQKKNTKGIWLLNYANIASIKRILSNVNT